MISIRLRKINLILSEFEPTTVFLWRVCLLIVFHLGFRYVGDSIPTPDFDATGINSALESIGSAIESVASSIGLHD